MAEVRSLETEAQRNLELICLAGRLAPDVKTIADFRRDNGAAIRKVCKEFDLLCRRIKLVTDGIVAILVDAQHVELRRVEQLLAQRDHDHLHGTQVEQRARPHGLRAALDQALAADGGAVADCQRPCLVRQQRILATSKACANWAPVVTGANPVSRERSPGWR